MIQFDKTNRTYTCPYCGMHQAFSSVYSAVDTLTRDTSDEGYKKSYGILSIRCSNRACSQISVIAIRRHDGYQVDIEPQHVFLRFPDYIPAAIRSDYEEASQILDLSPKAAATLLRRCLQGMIRDFWNISKGRLIDEIKELKNRVPAVQWQAIDGLRQLGNIGAHMEEDVNVIIDIEKESAQKLLKLIELLMVQWYINRHNQEALCNEIAQAAATKREQKSSSNA